MKLFSSLILSIFCSLFLTAQQSPFPRESRLDLAGFHRPITEIVIEELPLVDETSPILNLDSHKLWIFYFIEPQHPYYLEERKNFDEFKETRDKEDLGCYMVSSREDSSLIDSDGRCAMLLGIKDKTAVVIMDQQGKLIAIKETQQMSWQQEDFLLAVEELVFN